MKLALIGTGNMPLMQWILDGKGDDAIINMSALARRLECSRSSLLDRVHTHGFDSAIRYYLSEHESRVNPGFFLALFIRLGNNRTS